MARLEVPEVTGLDWKSFSKLFGIMWHQGEHVEVLGPTGAGKSVLDTNLLGLRKYVLVLDPKGGDSTWRDLKWPRVPTWPLDAKWYKKMDAGQPVRLILAPPLRTREDVPKMRPIFDRALSDVFAEGGWTLAVSELQILTDRRMMALGRGLDTLLVAARDRKVSVVSEAQQPAWGSQTAGRMASYLFAFYVRDLNVVRRISEMSGRPMAEITGALRGLDRFACAMFTRNPRDPIYILQAPRP